MNEQGEPANIGGKLASEAESKSPSLTISAALIVTAINGAIAFFGWNSATAIKEYERKAKADLDAIQSVVDRSYILYARASEREFTDLVDNSPGIELPGHEAEQVAIEIREDRKNLGILEKEVAEDKLLPTRFLMDGYLAFVGGKCKEAIASLEQYPNEVPVKYHLLAVAYERCGNKQKAIELNHKIEELPISRPSERIKAKAMNNLGNIYVGEGRLDEAVVTYLSALRADPTLIGVNYNLAAAYSEHGRQEDAIKRLCKYKAGSDPTVNVINAVETDPDNDFKKLIQQLGAQWKTNLTAKLSGCTP